MKFTTTTILVLALIGGYPASGQPFDQNLVNAEVNAVIGDADQYAALAVSKCNPRDETLQTTDILFRRIGWGGLPGSLVYGPDGTRVDGPGWNDPNNPPTAKEFHDFYVRHGLKEWHSTREAAEQAALEQCRYRGDPSADEDCRVVLWWRNGCGAFIQGPGNCGFGAAAATTEAVALLEAHSKCMERTPPGHWCGAYGKQADQPYQSGIHSGWRHAFAACTRNVDDHPPQPRFEGGGRDREN